ncbi:hypothetical protein ACFXOD_06340 [Streptomyces sp. NPDC059161]|uniref:hypothetical protein n=1 Tax=Streptomyces sp. NPDC059161 TaxID=3346749 RepID=UPI0036CFE85E
MTVPSVEVLERLAEAVVRRASEQREEILDGAPEVRPPKQPKMRPGVTPGDTHAAGNAVSTAFFVDHYFGYPYGSLTMWDGVNWHGLGTLTAQDEQGAMQVAFASNRVEVNWKDNGDISSIRCWKFLS